MAAERIAAALQRLQSILRRRPSAGMAPDAAALSKWQGGARFLTCHADGGQVLTDLPEALGGDAAGAGVLAKLAEVLFIEVLRLYMGAQNEQQRGWLCGVRDRIVGAALSALHREPARAWTLEELARTAGTSRSVLAERFQFLVGSSPMQYLTQWRMVLASNLLRRSNSSMVQIAEAVGYQTDTAFSRAFRREFGEPPAAWRRSRVARSGEGTAGARL